MMSNEQIFKRLYKNEYMVQLESVNADRAKRLATIHAVKRTPSVWREQFKNSGVKITGTRLTEKNRRDA